MKYIKKSILKSYKNKGGIMNKKVLKIALKRDENLEGMERP